MLTGCQLLLGTFATKKYLSASKEPIFIATNPPDVTLSQIAMQMVTHEL